MSKPKLSPAMRRVLELYAAMEKESLDLHVLFEAGGNDPHSRQEILEAVASLIEVGYLRPSGSDYYARTAQGQEWLDTPT